MCDKEVKYYGQLIGVIVADREKVANKAAKLVKIKYKTVSKNKPLITIDEVLQSKQRNHKVRTDSTIEPSENGHDIKTVVQGELKMYSQYHYTMETQTCVANPTEDGIELYSATQWLDLTNVAVANCLKVPVNR